MASSLLYIPWFKLEPWEIPVPGAEFSIPIQPFGVLVAIGVILGAEVAKAYGKKRGISPDAIADFVTHVVGLGFLGAMTLNMAFYRPGRFTDMAAAVEWPGLHGAAAVAGLVISALFAGPLVMAGLSGKAPRRSLVVGLVAIGGVTVLAAMLPGLIPQLEWPGLSSYGGFIGAVAGLFLWRWRRKVPTLPLADVVVFGLPFGWLFGRMGCFVVHDHPGRSTDFFLAVADYQFGAPPYVARHDLGLYEVLWSLACVGLLLLLARKERPVGFYAGLVPLLYAPVRFYLDTLRAPAIEGGDIRYLGLTPAQYASIAFLLLGIALLIRAYTRPAPVLPEEVRWPPAEPQPRAKPGSGTAKAGTAKSSSAKSSSSAKPRPKPRRKARG